MNYYFNTLQGIEQSVDQLSKDEHHSLEIKQSAVSLRSSVQPCIEELKQSATRLQRLVLGCTNELNYAEDVWLSKQRIMEAENHKIWEQLGEISGRSVRLRQVGTQSKIQAVEEAKKSWNERIDFLTKKWFVDAKGQFKKGIGWDDKKGFVNAIYPIFNYQCEEVSRMTKDNLEPVCQEVLKTHSKLLQYCVSLLDQQIQVKVSKEIDLIASEIQIKFSNPVEHRPYDLLELRITVSPDLKALIDKGWNDIYWEDVVKFRDDVSVKIERFITAIFDDRIILAAEAIAKAMAFYNDFLEQQERYQQETPEQREAEKVWIDQQRHELARMQDGIEVILSTS